MKIAKIVDGPGVEIFPSKTAAANDIGISRFKFHRRLKKDGHVKGYDGGIYVLPIIH